LTEVVSSIDRRHGFAMFILSILYEIIHLQALGITSEAAMI